MPEDIEVNEDYCYDSQDIIQLTSIYQSQEDNPNNIWGQPLGFNGIDNPLELGGYNLKQSCEELKPNQKLLLPINLQNAYHWVGAIIEKVKGKFRITTMNSLGGHEDEIQETAYKISEELGSEHNIELVQTPPKTTLKQKDRASCGAFVMQNLINHATPKEAVELGGADIRRVHMELAGDNFAKKQKLDLQNKTKSEQDEITWNTVIAKQADEIQKLIPQAQERKKHLEKRNNSFEEALDHLLKDSQDKNKDLKNLYKEFPEHKELLDDVTSELTIASAPHRVLEPNKFEKALDHVLNIEDDLVKRMQLQSMQENFPEQKKLLDDIKQSMQPELTNTPTTKPIAYNRRISASKGVRRQ